MSATRVPKQRDAYDVVRVYPWIPERASFARGGNYRRALRLAERYRAKPRTPVGALVIVYGPDGSVRHRWRMHATDGWVVDERVDYDATVVPGGAGGATP